MHDDPIAHFLAAYRDTVWRKDAEGFAACFAEDVGIFDTWDDWQSRGRAAVLAMATGWFRSLGEERVEVSFEDVRSHLDADLASVSATARYSAIAATGERLRSHRERASFVLRRQATGDWQVVHQHSSVPVGFGSKQAVLLDR